MNDQWLTRSELENLTGWSVRTIQAKVKSGSLAYCFADKRERNGKPARLYAVRSLSPELQVELARRRSQQSGHTAIIVADERRQAIEVAAPQSLVPAEKKTRQPVTEDDYKQIDERLKALNPLIQYLNPTSRQPLLIQGPNGQPLRNSEEIVKYIAAAISKSRATIWRWYKRFAELGPQGLLDEVRDDKGQSRFFVTHPTAATYVQDKFLNERLSVRATYEAFCRDFAGSPCTYETLRTYLNALPAPIRTLAREGRRAYTDRMAPYIKRAYTDVFSNEIWVSDHVILDIEAQNDVFDDAERGAPIRIRLTDLLDFRSRYIVGVSFSWEGSSRSIANALLHASETYGPCDVLYCDNGKDYKKVGKGALPAHLRKLPDEAEQWQQQELEQLDKRGVLAYIGASVTYCIPFHPQSKHVERWHRTLHEHFCKLFPTYTGGRPDRRPDSTTARMGLHRKLLRMGTPELSDHPLASKVIQLCLQWIAEYNHRPHSGQGMNDRSPAEVFAAYRNPNQRPPMDRRELFLLLADKQKRTVQECSVRFKGKEQRRYVGCDEAAVGLLHSFNDREVLVARIAPDNNEAAILDLDGHFLCWACLEQLLSQSPEANEAVAESMKQRRRLERGVRDELSAIARENRQIGARSEVEHLEEHALAVAVGGVRDWVTQRNPNLKRNSANVVVPTRVRCAEDVADQLLEMDGE